ncbi:MAG TPA: T9SS type A sorting domain-containing protein, partial [Candidatus Kapabacteria bacterium]
LIGLTPGVISDNSTGHGHVISSNCNFGRRHSDPNYCTPPNRGSVMIDTPTLQTTISRFAVSDFNCPTSGAEQTPTQQKSIAITPNPSNSIVRLSFESENETGIAIHIYNSRGAIVRTIRDDAVAVGDWSRTISMSDCVEGTYLVQLIQGSDIRMGRFMLLKQ